MKRTKLKNYVVAGEYMPNTKQERHTRENNGNNNSNNNDKRINKLRENTIRKII